MQGEDAVIALASLWAEQVPKTLPHLGEVHLGTGEEKHVCKDRLDEG